MLRTTNKQNKQHGAIVCSNYGLLYIQHISPHKLTNKSEYQTTQNLIRNSNKSNKYRIIEYWITSLIIITIEKYTTYRKLGQSPPPTTRLPGAIGLSGRKFWGFEISLVAMSCNTNAIVLVYTVCALSIGLEQYQKSYPVLSNTQCYWVLPISIPNTNTDIGLLPHVLLELDMRSEVCCANRASQMVLTKH